MFLVTVVKVARLYKLFVGYFKKWKGEVFGKEIRFEGRQRK